MNRRSMLAAVAAAAVPAALAGQALAQSTAPARPMGENPTGAAGTNAAGMNAAGTRAEETYRRMTMMTGMLSLETSQVALDKATNPMVREFATFEAEEQKAIAAVLKDMTPGPDAVTLDAKGAATLEKLRSTPKGAAFDKEYVRAQVEGHEMLRDIQETLLKSTGTGNADMSVMHHRHVATLSLPTIKQHIAMAKKLDRELS